MPSPAFWHFDEFFWWSHLPQRCDETKISSRRSQVVSPRQLRYDVKSYLSSRSYEVCCLSRPKNRVRKSLCNLRTLKLRSGLVASNIGLLPSNPGAILNKIFPLFIPNTDFLAFRITSNAFWTPKNGQTCGRTGCIRHCAAYSCGQLKSTNWVSQEPDFLAEIWWQFWNQTSKRSSKMVFSCYSHAFLAAPKFWASFFASYIAISASLSEKSCSSSSSLFLSAFPSLLLNPQLHLPHFSWAIGVTLKISWSILHHLPHWQCDGLEKWCHWWNGSQTRVILEACKVVMDFRRTASRFVQHSSNFFQREGSISFFFFWWILTVLIEIYPKTTFSRFYRFFWACAKILDFFSDKSSLLGNRFVPFERFTQFLPIPMVFGLFKNPYRSQ